MLETTFLAVFTTGLLGGVHCAGMCGGIVGVLSLRPPVQPIILAPKLMSASVSSTGVITHQQGSSSASFSSQKLNTMLLYNVGRITTYFLLGALAGGIGSIGSWMQWVWPLQQASFVITNIMLLFIGLYLAGYKQIGLFFESAGQIVWRLVQPQAVRQLNAQSNVSALLAGGLWGLVPCGMVYAVLIAALVSGSAGSGAILMLAFGLGTLPNLLLLGSASQWFVTATKNNVIRKTAGAIIVSFGVLGLLRLDIAAQIPLIKELCVRLP